MSMASELLNRVKKHNYNVVVPYLDPDTALNPRDVRSLKNIMRQSGKHVETDKFYNRVGTEKPDALFEVFGNYCGKNGTEVREMMIDYAYRNRRSLEAEFRNALSVKAKDFGWWILRQTNKKRSGDELTVYLLSKMFDRHSLIYTLKEPWCTFVHKIGTELSVLLGKSDLVFVYTTHGFGQIVDLPPNKPTTQKSKKATRSPKEKNPMRTKRCNANNHISKETGNQSESKSKRMKRCNNYDNTSGSTPNSTLKVTAPKSTQQRQRQSHKTITSVTSSTPVHVNKVSALLSAAHIIESNRPHNTRRTNPKRKRNNPRSARSGTKVDYSNFYDSNDDVTDSSPSPKRQRTTAEISLREPTEAQINAQRIITRKRLQEMSPTGHRVRLIGTAITPQPLLKSNIKTENLKRETAIKTEQQLEINDYLAKGLCLSAHSDGTPCANIQNPNNVNVAPMGIREHRRKQRAEKALFLAGLLTKQSKQADTTARNAVTDTAPSTSDVQINEVSTSTKTMGIPKLSELCNRIAVTNDEARATTTLEQRCLDPLQDNDRNVVTSNDVDEDPVRFAENPINDTSTDPVIEVTRNGVNSGNVGESNIDVTNTKHGLSKTVLDDIIQQEVDLDVTMEYIQDIDIPSPSPTVACNQDSSELVVNKSVAKTYTRTKTSVPIQHRVSSPSTVSTPSTDIDMIEDTRNAELLTLSDNLAESLVITDLEELMNEQNQSEEAEMTTARDRPTSPRGTFSYNFMGI